MKQQRQATATANKVPCYGTGLNGEPLRTQEAKVLDYLLRTGGRVSNKFMAEKWGFHRCSALIYNLKKRLALQGGLYVLRWEDCKGVSRFGARTTWRDFWLEKVK